MSEQPPRTAYHRRTADRWQDWLDGAGTRCAERQVVNYGRTDADAGEAPPQLFVREVFARAHPDERRALDLLLVVLVERGSRSGSRPPAGELVVLGPEVIRAQTTAGVAGLTVNELRVGPVMPELRSLSLALVRITRGGRSQDVVSSIEELGRLLDYERDPVGSAAVAHAIVRRLEVLTSGPGVTVSVAGAVSRPGDGSGPEAMHLLTDANAPLALDDDVELRDGRLMTVGRGRRPAAWRGGDYVIVRAGRPAARRAEVVRSLAQLRREHALAEASLGSETKRLGDTYSSRATSARQSLRAEQIVQHATAGDADGAAKVLRVALTQPGARGPLVDSVAGGLVSVRDYWSVLPAVRRAEDDAGTTPEARSIAEVMRERLGQRLDQILALSANESSDLFIPVVTPIVLEVSDALVPIVDSRQDDGYFLYDLVPAMKDRGPGRDGRAYPRCPRARQPGARAG